MSMTEQDVSRAFELLYLRAPTQAETANVLAHGVLASSDFRQMLRRIIACTDRHALATPYNIRFSEGDLRSAPTADFELVFDEADVSVGRTIGAGHPYEPHVLKFCREHIRPGHTVVDAGANIGFFTMTVAQLVGPRGQVIAFEPNSENCRLILISAKKNGLTNLKLYPVALGAENGTMAFSPAMGSNGMVIYNSEEPLLNPNCAIVPVFKMDNLVYRCDFIKADIEGAEGLAFKGGMEMVKRCRPIIVSEFCPVMLDVSSKMTPLDYLGMFEAIDYEISVLDREQPDAAPRKVKNAAELMASYPGPHHVADLALTPAGVA